MKISAAIMAHPDRATQAKKLEKELSAMAFSDVYIIYNEIEEGHPHDREWDTGKRSLRWGIGKGDWHMVIQDDAILTPDFYENLSGALQNCPLKTLISLYTGTSRPFPQRVSRAVETASDGDWLHYWLLLWGVAIVIPTDHIPEVLEYCEGLEEPYDTRLGIFYANNMLPVYYTMPSLVDHDDSIGSLLGHGIEPGERVAHRPAIKKVQFGRRIIDM